MPGNCSFNEVWTTNPLYSEWLAAVKTDKTKAKCQLCGSIFDIAKMGISALNSHMKGKKHSSLIDLRKKSLGIQAFVSSRSSSEGHSNPTSSNNPRPSDNKNSNSAGNSDPVSTINKPSTSEFFIKHETLKAEILWAIKVCTSHYSYNSCTDTSDLFREMFPDSKIAQNFALGETKCAYLICFGLAPYFLSSLTKQLENEIFVILFDETTNHKLQEKQLDFHVRYWDKQSKLVKTSYIHSDFLGHATSDILVECFSNLLMAQNLSKHLLIQLSMDGPNVNWKFYDTVCDQIKNDANNRLLHTGSCGLHIIHNAFKKGEAASGWAICDILSSLYKLFKDSPARREDFVNVTGSDKFPLKLCKVRWVENGSVANRAIDIWPEVVKFVKAVENKKIPNPKTKTFDIVKDAANDNLMVVKLKAFVSIVNIIEPFLVLYQTDHPMLPFLAKDLETMLRKLMERCLKETTLKKATSKQLLEINLDDKENKLPLHKVNMGFSAENILKTLLREGSVKEPDAFSLRKQCRSFLLSVISALSEKSPLKYSVVQFSSCFDPRNMNDDNPNTIKTFQSLLYTLNECGKVVESQCDSLISTFKEFIIEFGFTENFKQFKPGKDRLDEIFFECTSISSKYDKLWDVMKIVLILSHGQASVERGFSVNKQIETENMKGRTIIAQRIVCEYISVLGGVTKLDVSKDLLQYAAGARQKWQQFLEDQRRNRNKNNEDLKRKLITDELKELKIKKQRLLEDIESLTKSADRFAERAETSSSLTLISKSNSFRRSASEKKNYLKEIDSKIDEVLTALKNKY
jgi:hypothetical protein